MGNGEWGMGNGEWGMGNGKWRMENKEWGMGNEKWRMRNGASLHAHFAHDVSSAIVVFNPTLV